MSATCQIRTILEFTPVIWVLSNNNLAVSDESLGDRGICIQISTAITPFTELLSIPHDQGQIKTWMTPLSDIKLQGPLLNIDSPFIETPKQNILKFEFLEDPF